MGIYYDVGTYSLGTVDLSNRWFQYLRHEYTHDEMILVSNENCFPYSLKLAPWKRVSLNFQWKFPRTFVLPQKRKHILDIVKRTDLFEATVHDSNFLSREFGLLEQILQRYGTVLLHIATRLQFKCHCLLHIATLIIGCHGYGRY